MLFRISCQSSIHLLRSLISCAEMRFCHAVKVSYQIIPSTVAFQTKERLDHATLDSLSPAPTAFAHASTHLAHFDAHKSAFAPIRTSQTHHMRTIGITQFCITSVQEFNDLSEILVIPCNPSILVYKSTSGSFLFAITASLCSDKQFLITLFVNDSLISDWKVNCMVSSIFCFILSDLSRF